MSIQHIDRRTTQLLVLLNSDSRATVQLRRRLQEAATEHDNSHARAQAVYEQAIAAIDAEEAEQSWEANVSVGL